MSNLKNWCPKKYEVKGHNMHNSNKFIASQNLLYNFLNEFLMCFFVQDLVYLRLISNPRNQDMQWTPLHKILNRKITIIYFQNQVFNAKIRLRKGFFRNMNYKK